MPPRPSITSQTKTQMRRFFWPIVAALTPLPWMFLELSGQGHHLAQNHPGFVSFLSGAAIVGAAFILTWGAELSERDIPRSLALITLALISVLPEYAVDLHFAWAAGKDPSYAPYAVANMTGANRLLIGISWALVVLIACQKSRSHELAIHPRQRLEI